jgi:hypothetical protein
MLASSLSKNGRHGWGRMTLRVDDLEYARADPLKNLVVLEFPRLI